MEMYIHTTEPTRDSQKKVYPKGSLVSVWGGNSMGQVMEQGVMMHQQHQPWVAPPAEVADGTQEWRGAMHSDEHTQICTISIHPVFTVKTLRTHP